MNSGIQLHEYIVLPHSRNLFPVSGEKHSLAIDAIVLETSMELLAVGQNELALPRFVIAVEIAYVSEYCYPSTAPRNLISG